MTGNQLNTGGELMRVKAYYTRRQSSLLAEAERLSIQVLSFGNLRTSILLLVERTPAVSFGSP